MDLRMRNQFMTLTATMVNISILCSLLTGCLDMNTAPKDTMMMRDPAAKSDVSIPSTSPNSQILSISVKSKSLGRNIDADIYVPPHYDPKKKYAVLYLFYGYGGNRESWFSSLHINEAADRLIQAGKIKPLLIVSPDYGNSFGVNTNPGEGHNPGGVDEGHYEDYLIKELIPYVDTTYSTFPAKVSRFIGGASMGGFAAIYLGFTYPQLFGKIGAHSAALWTYSSTDDFIDQRDWLFANKTLRRKRDPFLLVADGSRLKESSVYLDAGDQDSLAEKDRQLYELLRSKHVQADWSLHSGGHDMKYWSSQLDNYLLFYAGTGR
jgi:enterochelin esterase-like enzyme